MTDPRARKTIRSYRLVFRRRWRIHRIQGWRIPLPGGIELRLLAYWLAALLGLALLARLPLLGALPAALPASLRLLALPLAAAWLLSRWELDGRAPHRALLGLMRWRLRPRTLAGLRRVPSTGTRLAPLDRLLLAPDLTGSTYPRGLVAGPATVLLRFPLRVAPEARGFGIATRGGGTGERLRSARRWRLTPIGGAPLQTARTLGVPAGRRVLFEPAES